MTGAVRIIRAKCESSSFWCQSSGWCASPFVFLRYKFAKFELFRIHVIILSTTPSDMGGVLLTTYYIGTKGLLLYNYFSDCDWEWVLKDFAKDDMFCGNDSMFFLIVICVLCQCPLPSLKCYLLSNLWVPSPRLLWMPYFSCSFSCLHLIQWLTKLLTCFSLVVYLMNIST